MREVNRRTVGSDLVDELFPSRWSPRAFTGKRITDDEFLALIEAARWAPSSFNEQPWRFISAARDGDSWEAFNALLSEGNRSWAHRASHLLILLAKETRENGEPYPGSAFDCGAAWMSLALQAQLMGIATHPMGGFDKTAAKDLAKIPEGFSPLIMIAVGEPGPVETLPEHLQARERSRSQRKDIEGIMAHTAFSKEWN